MRRNRNPRDRDLALPVDHPAPSRWTCDTCDQVIQCPEEGMLEWHDVARGERNSPRVLRAGFTIVHNQAFSPLQGLEGCYRHGRRKGRGYDHLNWFVRTEGLAHMLSFVDVGFYHEPKYMGPEIANMREWAEIMRRLYLPYYEDARHYWPEAEADGLFDAINELGIYDPAMLQRIVGDYSPRQ